MSYILDALKRADAERERGHVPGLHSQSASAPAPLSTRAHPNRPAPVLMVGFGAVLLSVAAAAWYWLSASSGESTPITAVQPPAATADTPAVPPAPAMPILAPPPVAVPATAHPAAAPGPSAATQPGASAGNTMPGTTSAATPTTPATTGSKGDVRSIAELPPATRAQLPQLSISGSTHSTNPAHRMLIANGKVVHEGEEIAPGLRLEAIGPDKAVLNHLGTRYSVGY